MRTLMTVTLAALVLLPACEDKRAASYVEEQMPAFRRLGVSDLKAAVQPELAVATRKDAAVQAALGDEITELAIWTELSKRDASDAEAAHEGANLLVEFGDMDAALERLDRVDVAGAARKEKRAPAKVSTDVMQWRCAVQRRMQRLPEAQKSCEAAILAGAGIEAQRLLVKIHLALGANDAALGIVDKLVKDEARATFDDWYSLALAQDAAGRAEPAKEAFEKTLRLMPSFTPAELALSGKLKTVAERQAAEIKWQRSAFALKLARCWHLCFELELEDRAKRCAQEADKIEPGRVDAQRVLHLMEVDPGGAVKEADSLLAGRPHPDLFAAKARALVLLGQTEEARRVLEAGLALDPASPQIHSVLAGVCAALKDEGCVAASRQRLMGEVEQAQASRSSRLLMGGIIGGAVLLAVAAFAYLWFRKPKRILPP